MVELNLLILGLETNWVMQFCPEKVDVYAQKNLQHFFVRTADKSETVINTLYFCVY